MTLEQTAFENVLGKGENACKSFFYNVFNSIRDETHHSSNNKFVLSIALILDNKGQNFVINYLVNIGVYG